MTDAPKGRAARLASGGKTGPPVSQGPTVRGRLISIVVVAVLAYGGIAGFLATGNAPKLGLDLAGGTEVVLQAPPGTTETQLNDAVEIMRRRISALGGVLEPVIQIVGDNQVDVQLPGVTDREQAIAAVGSTGQLSFRKVLPLVDPSDVNEDGSVDFEGALAPIDPKDDDPTKEAILLTETGIPIRVGPAFALGSDIADAAPALDPQTSEWSVGLRFTPEGADAFAQATRELAQFQIGDERRSFAIVLDGEVISTPFIAASVNPAIGISGGSAQITTGGGPEGQSEADALSIVLRFGALPIVLEQDRVQNVSATLGGDSLNSGIVSGLLGLGLVAAALIAYYRVLGLVAVVGLTVFGSVLVAVYSLLGITAGLTLTLSGVAGLIVAIGITADSYIVFFERIKEDLGKGLPMRRTVESGFSRAFRTILTADTVSFVGALLLWILAIGPVKGFALALGLATIIDVFVAYFYTRNAVALLARGPLGDGGSFSIRGASGIRSKTEEVPA